MKNLSLNNENDLYLSGVKKIIACSPNQAAVDTDTKRIIFTGNQIEVKKLDLENNEICLHGTFANIKFLDHAEKKTLLKRIFK